MTSIYGDEYRRALALLVEARRRSGTTQQQLADKLGRPQSFVSKFETGERRLDVAEFINIAHLLGSEPFALLRKAGVGGSKQGE